MQRDVDVFLHSLCFRSAAGCRRIISSSLTIFAAVARAQRDESGLATLWRCARLIEGGMKEVGSTRAHRATCTCLLVNAGEDGWLLPNVHGELKNCATCWIDSSRIQRVVIPLRTLK